MTAVARHNCGEITHHSQTNIINEGLKREQTVVHFKYVRPTKRLVIHYHLSTN